MKIILLSGRGFKGFGNNGFIKRSNVERKPVEVLYGFLRPV
ncbi:MAG TPA: hypothetical protein VLH37_03600 [Bacteroidales bacterium]|nr:hypothetical protein [Bacteroidales bacterium]